MSQPSETEPKPSLSRRLAIASLVAPGIALLANSASSALYLVDTREAKLIVGGACSALIVAGLVCSIVALCGIRKHGKKGILGSAIAGLMVNLFLIVSAVVAFQVLLKIRENPKPRISVNVPSYFTEFPGGKDFPNVTHSFVKGDPEDDRSDIFCFIEKLGGTIKRDQDLNEFDPGMPNVSLSKEQWKGFSIDVFRIEEVDQQGLEFLTFNAQLPTVPVATQVKVFGLLAEEEQILTELRAVLKGIDGPSNW